jgi:subtilisin family serine protease
MKIIFILFTVLISSCKSNFLENKKITNDNNKMFSFYDQELLLNKTNGVSLEKWYEENKTRKTKNQIIVAILDSQIDLNHEELQGQILVNKKEIPNNEMDDDHNGYIDDINGWNFIGHKNSGYLRYRNFEYTRIVRLKKEYFDLNSRTSNDSIQVLNEYYKAEKKQKEQFTYNKNWLKSLEYTLNNRQKVEDTLKHYFPKENYTYSQLDSLYNVHKINDKTFKQRRDDNDSDLGALISTMMMSIQMKETKEDLIGSKNQLDSIVYRNLNIDYDDRKYIGDNSKILEKGYGNNRLNENTFQLGHNTAVSSIIAANRNNNIGTKGFHQNIKIMPLSISASGDEHDKDIAMAIYYAVDNGAKIINMSFGKEFSLRQEWVTDAFKYAEKHNVLLVHGSGNNRFNVDENPYYPSDIDYLINNKDELVSNFINVGSISKRTDSTMVSPFSDYGKQNVDIFAPGEDIYVAKPNNEYGYDSGTSLAAPMVSGTAALIWLYYPKLTVQEVKKIILESGVFIDQKVIKPGTKDEMVSFSELCKTGKVLNTYNAMKMAEEISKHKK